MDSVQFQLAFDATPRQLWEAWTNPSIVAQWFGSDPKGIVDSVVIDLKKGGGYSVTFHDSDDTEHTCSGVYTTVSPYKHIAFSWEWKSEPGHVTQIDITLRVQEQKTVMVFIHSNLGTHSAHQYKEGWEKTFQKLRQVLRAR